jgi:hypothetical protein
MIQFILEEIVKKLYRFNMPSEIIQDESRSEASWGLQPSLYEENNKRVVTTLRSLGFKKEENMQILK